MKKFIYLITILSLVSCKRKEDYWFPNTTISGTVTDYCTGVPLANIRLTLVSGNYFSPTDLTNLRTVTTGADGFYEIKFGAFSDGTYSIRVEDDVEFTAIGEVKEFYPYITGINKGDHKTVNVIAVNNNPQAYLKLKIDNTTPFNNHDSIYLQFTEPNYQSFYAYGYPPYQFYPQGYVGAAVDSTRIIGAFGCVPLKIDFNWAVTKNNVTVKYKDSIVCASNTTTPYTIAY